MAVRVDRIRVKVIEGAGQAFTMGLSLRWQGATWWQKTALQMQAGGDNIVQVGGIEADEMGWYLYAPGLPYNAVVYVEGDTTHTIGQGLGGLFGYWRYFGLPIEPAPITPGEPVLPPEEPPVFAYPAPPEEPPIAELPAETNMGFIIFGVLGVLLLVGLVLPRRSKKWH